MNENSQHIGANVLPLGAGGDFETQIDHGNSKPDRTTQRIVTVKPRLRQTAVMLSPFILFCYKYRLNARSFCRFRLFQNSAQRFLSL